MRFRGLGVVAAAAALTLVLAGCGEDEPATGSVGEGGSDDATMAPQAPDDTEEPTEPPDEPANGEDDGENGDVVIEGDDTREVEEEEAAEARAFVEEFLTEYDTAATNGDFSQLETMYADSCQRCADNIDQFESLYANGQRVEGGGFTDPTIAVDGAVDDEIMVRVESTIGAYVVLDSSGDEVESGPEEPARDLFEISQDDDGDWQVVRWSGT